MFASGWGLWLGATAGDIGHIGHIGLGLDVAVAVAVAVALPFIVSIPTVHTVQVFLIVSVCCKPAPPCNLYPTPSWQLNCFKTAISLMTFLFCTQEKGKGERTEEKREEEGGKMKDDREVRNVGNCHVNVKMRNGKMQRGFGFGFGLGTVLVGTNMLDMVYVFE